MKYYYEGVERLDWGFDNPNITAALIVQLMFLSWLPAYLPWGRSTKLGCSLGFIVSLSLTFYWGDLLMQTYSRGAIIAALLGHICLVLFVLFRVSRRTFIVSAFLVLIGVSFLCSLESRLPLFSRLNQVSNVNGAMDKGSQSRAIVYMRVPSMLFDSPKGWGHLSIDEMEGYRQYYQPIDRSYKYQNLLSGHFTRLVQWSWSERILYILAWVAVLMLCCPVLDQMWKGACVLVSRSARLIRLLKHKKCSCLELKSPLDCPKPHSIEEDVALHRRGITKVIGTFREFKAYSWFGCVFASVLSLMICDQFSYVTQDPVIYYPSIAGVNSVLLVCLWQRALPIKQLLVFSLLGGLTTLSLLKMLDSKYNENSTNVEVHENFVLLGENPTIWMISPEEAKEVYGEWGKSLREVGLSARVYHRWGDLPKVIPENVSLVLAADQWFTYRTLGLPATRVILINPEYNITIQEWSELKEVQVDVLFGEFNQRSGREAWHSLAEDNPKWQFIELEGDSNYSESWSELIKELEALTK